MNKQNIFFVIVGIVMVSGVLMYLFLSQNTVTPVVGDDVVFYYGVTCPHCKIVEEYIAENSVHEKMQFVQKEVYNNAQNSQELKRVAQDCGIEPTQVGVPLLWDGTMCFVGDKDIIAYFATELTL